MAKGLRNSVVGACLFLAAQPLSPFAVQWRADERSLVTDFSQVNAVAASPFTLYAATTHGLIIYNRNARAWDPPVTALDGYPAGRVRVALADATDDAVWLGTTDGWARYDKNIRQWQGGAVPGGVTDLAFDARDPASGIFVRSPIGWAFLQRGGIIPVNDRPLPPPGQMVRPLDPRSALDLAPMADAMRALILTDPRLRAHQFTAAARTPDQTDLYFGTDGMGIVRIDPATAQWEALPYGLVAPGAGALALGSGGVWVAAAARVGERRGLSWVSDDLSRVAAIEGTGTLGMQFLTGRRILSRAGRLWIATERGALRYDPETGRTRMFDDARGGLPDAAVWSLAPAPDGVWVGTARGLAVVADNDSITRIGGLDQPVLALLSWRDTLWIGSVNGLGVLGPGGATAVVPPAVSAQPALALPVVALARVGDTLVAATADQLAWRDPKAGTWTVQRARGDLGRILSLAGDDGGVWVGGTQGLSFWPVARLPLRTLHVPIDLPAAVRDIAVDGARLWVATDSGVVRFDRHAVIDR